MDIYFLICCHEQNAQNYNITRILKCIPTTVDKASETYDEYIKQHIQYPGVFSMMVSRNADLSFLTKEAENNGR